MVYLLSSHVIRKFSWFDRALSQWCKELEQLRTSKALALAWKLKGARSRYLDNFV